MPTVEAKIANLLYPLTDFYSSAGREAPRLGAIEGNEMPEPYRSLLVHSHDMTPTLEAHSGKPIHLKLLQVRRTDDALYRQVLLMPNGDARPIEFGAIRIDLPRFEEGARNLIVEGYRPLGAILREFTIPHRSRPSAYFWVEADAWIGQSLGEEMGRKLYGRHNTIYGTDDKTLAEVVEILPALPQTR